MSDLKELLVQLAAGAAGGLICGLILTVLLIVFKKRRIRKFEIRILLLELLVYFRSVVWYLQTGNLKNTEVLLTVNVQKTFSRLTHILKPQEKAMDLMQKAVFIETDIRSYIKSREQYENIIDSLVQRLDELICELEKLK